MELYTAFRGFRPTEVQRVEHPRLIPPVVIDLGELVGLVYRAEKGQPGRPQTFIHFMQEPPRLVCNVGGTRLYIVGGHYRITAEGIEG